MRRACSAPSGTGLAPSGMPQANRLAILLHVLEAPLGDLLKRLRRPDTHNWGEPMTRDRLHRIAKRLAQDVRNERDQSAPALQAVKEWNADRTWLKNHFYDASFDWRWPEPYSDA